MNTHSGEHINLHFEDEVIDSGWEDLEVEGLLVFDIELIAIDGGVDIILKNLSCIAIYEGNSYEVEIRNVERTFLKECSETMPDDINPINMKSASINLGKVLREEILMQIL